MWWPGCFCRRGRLPVSGGLGRAGATVPLTGFGYSLAKGVAKAVAEKGPLGILTGGLTATSGGIAAAVVFAVLAAIFFKPKEKR